MPRKHKDDVIGVVEYFEQASVDAAKATYAIIGAIIARRFPTAAKVEKKKPTPRQKVTNTLPGPQSTVGG